MKNMFHEIDENTWDRKEIYDAFYGYTYAMTVQLDMTEQIGRASCRERV